MPPPPEPTDADREAAEAYTAGDMTDYEGRIDAFVAGIRHEREKAATDLIAAIRAEREWAATVAEEVGHNETRKAAEGLNSIWGIYREIAAAIRRGPQ